MLTAMIVRCPVANGSITSYDPTEALKVPGVRAVVPVLPPGFHQGATGGVGRNHKSMEIWPRYAADLRGGKALPCGHYLSEEAPNETYAELRAFFAEGETL